MPLSSNPKEMSRDGLSDLKKEVQNISESVVELNIGGVFYATALSTLTKYPDSFFGKNFLQNFPYAYQIAKDSKGKYFIDRDGVLFRYILDYLRNDKLVLPENFSEKERLKNEAQYFELFGMVEKIDKIQNEEALKARPGSIVLSYRGTFTMGRDGISDVKFRKINRLLVSGKIPLCREAFGETLNESRDPDRETVDRYTSRFFLSHTILEQAFDMLLEAGYKLYGSCASGASGPEKKPGQNIDEERWAHYNEFVWIR